MGGLMGLKGRIYPGSMLLVAILGLSAIGSARDATVAGLIALSSFAVAGSALELPRGGTIRLYGGVAVAAIGLLLPLPGALSVLAGMGAAGVVRPIGKTRLTSDLVEDGLRILVLLSISYVYHTTLLTGAPSGSVVRGAVLLACGTVFMLADLTFYSGARGGLDVVSGLSATGGLFRVLWAGYVAQISIGVVLVLVYPRLDFFSFLILTPLMLIMQHTTGLLLRVRASYMRTVGVLAEVAEMQTEGQNGHAHRVSKLAAHIGRSIGVGSRQLERLALAALLHDIGRLRAPSPADPTAVADEGATVLSRVSFLASLSPIIQKQSVAYWQVLDPLEQDGRLARIVRLASDVDLALQDSGGQPAQSVLDRFERESGRAYDPEAVAALRRVWHSLGETA
ncbi:MAG: HD domain-containing protein [Actinomycetota bacterium]|nr:HD domain-containing protein [Actinomycetota bacterium]